MEISAIEQEIVEEFDFFEDWTDKYEYIIERGQKLPPFPVERKTEAYKIKGCQSNVWIFTKEENGRIQLQGDSDSSIVKGLIALLIQVLSDQSPEDILQARLLFIERIGLSSHLAQTRANGLSAMVKQIKLDALALKNKNLEDGRN